MNIKEYRDKELKWFIIASILVFVVLDRPLVVLSKITNNSDPTLFSFIELIDSSLISGALGILCFIIDGLFSSDFKTILLYFGFINRMPGKSVFTYINKGKYRDVRYQQIDAQALYKDIYAAMPTGEKEKARYENSNWYRIYHKHRDISMIFNSNKDYLLCRDMYVASIIMLLLYVLASLFTSSISWNWIYIGYLLVMGMCTNAATRIKAKRFVLNVIAYDIQQYIVNKENR